MRIFKLFSSIKGLFGSGRVSANDLSNFIRSGCWGKISATEAYSLYDKISAIGHAVSIITEKFCTIEPVIKNSSGDIINNRDVMDLLKNPNGMESYPDFAMNACSSFLLNDNGYMVAVGYFRSKPSAIYNLKADNVSVSIGGNKATYLINTEIFYNFLSGSFSLDPRIGRILHFSNLKELYHFKGFSLSSSDLKATSRLSSIKGDADVLDQATTQMLSILKKGFGAAGIMSVDTNDQESFEQFKKDLQQHHGSGNTGKALAVKGKAVDFKKIEQTNREMYQIENKQDSRRAIYRRFCIPDPIVDQSSQTYNNYLTAQYALYDDAVFPVAKKIYGVLTKIFQDRGMLGKDEFITYNSASIPALQLRNNEEMKILKELDILTDNELRSRANYEGYGPDGDIHYKPASFIPVGNDAYIDDNLSAPQKEYALAMQKAGITAKEAAAFFDEYQKNTQNR